MAGKTAQPQSPEQIDPGVDIDPSVAIDYRAGQQKIAEIVKFHATPVVTQALREAFGWLGREAAAAAKRRPRNRPAEFATWPLPALRLLAELCEAYAPETGTVAAPREPEMFPDAADAAIAAHEDAVTAQSIAMVAPERLPRGTQTETVATTLDAPAEPANEPEGFAMNVHAPDAWIAPADWAQPNGASVEPPLFYVPDPWTDGEVGAGK